MPFRRSLEMVLGRATKATGEMPNTGINSKPLTDIIQTYELENEPLFDTSANHVQPCVCKKNKGNTRIGQLLTKCGIASQKYAQSDRPTIFN